MVNKERQIHHRLRKIPHVGAVRGIPLRHSPGRGRALQNHKIAIVPKEACCVKEITITR